MSKTTLPPDHKDSSKCLMNTRDVHVHARQLCEDSQLTKPDDIEVEGVWCVEVNASLSDEAAASAALDGFHSTIAVDMLDDFEFAVYIDGEQIMEDPERVAYSSSDFRNVTYHGPLQKPGPATPAP